MARPVEDFLIVYQKFVEISQDARITRNIDVLLEKFTKDPKCGVDYPHILAAIIYPFVEFNSKLASLQYSVNEKKTLPSLVLIENAYTIDDKEPRRCLSSVKKRNEAAAVMALMACCFKKNDRRPVVLDE